MYDNYISDNKYQTLKSRIIDIINGDDTTTDVEKLSTHIHQL
jgi:hypothetical protein